MTAWTAELDHVSRALLDQALDRLEQSDAEALPRQLAGAKSGFPHIRKLQLGGRVRLRPLLCTGPQDKREELTFLVPAFERNGKFDPANAVQQADERRLAVEADETRRIPYDR